MRCPRCSYTLEGLRVESQAIVCPECGETATLKAISAAMGWRRRSIGRVVSVAGAFACYVGSCWLVLESESGTGDGQAALAYIGFAVILFTVL